jgi:hypothetical protein
VTTFKVGDFVYVNSTNSIGEILAVFDARGVQDVRTDVDGMRDGADLEPLQANHFKKPGVFVAHSTACRYWRKGSAVFAPHCKICTDTVH